MTLQRRLLIYLLICAPAVWMIALAASANRARQEVNELFDTEIIRLARQVQATLGGLAVPPTVPAPPMATASAPGSPTASLPAPELSDGGEADLEDLAIAVWNADGQLVLVDREGVQLPRRPDASGFVDLTIDDNDWRVYYLQSPRGESLVAAGQRQHERDELVWNLVASQLLPWLLVLPVLMVAMTWAVRRALAPLRAVTSELQQRGADDLQPLAPTQAPAELQPLLTAMNSLFARIETALARERRFTADAAHELRTPLAVLRAQWDVLRRAGDDVERERAGARLGAGLDRMDRLITQMLALSRLEATSALPQAREIDWAPIVEQVMTDLLPLAERRRIDLGCEWPEAGQAPLPLSGDPDLLAVLLRNLLDNAVRYAPEGSTVTLRFEREALQVENGGPPLSPQAQARLGERFHRRDGQSESGSGLGVSIVQLVAALHGLSLRYDAGSDGHGVVARLSVVPG